MQSREQLAREKIDKLLTDCGWTIQNRSKINFSAARGVAVREALLKGRDEVDYLLFVDGKAIGTVEAKPEGHTLTGVEEQSGKYGASRRFLGEHKQARAAPAFRLNFLQHVSPSGSSTAARRSLFPTTSSLKAMPVKRCGASYSSKPTFVPCCACLSAS
jgi:hypothetical protein